MYCGTIMTDEGKERRITIDFEPFKPINTSLYLCDNKVRMDVVCGCAPINTYTTYTPGSHHRVPTSSLITRPPPPPPFHNTQFHTEALGELLEDDDRFGFIVMDGNGTLYGTLQVRGKNRQQDVAGVTQDGVR